MDEMIIIIFCVISFFIIESENMDDSDSRMLNESTINLKRIFRSDPLVSNGFSLSVNSSEFVVHDNILFTCQASRLNYSRIDWYFKTREELSTVKRLENATKMTIIDSIDEQGSTLKSTLLITDIDDNRSGIYYCNATMNLKSRESFKVDEPKYSLKNIKVAVGSIDKYLIKFHTNMRGQKFYVSTSELGQLLRDIIVFHCRVEGNATSEFTWYKNGKFLRTHDYAANPDRVFTESFLSFDKVYSEDLGEYKCESSNSRRSVSGVAYIAVREVLLPQESNKGLIITLVITSIIFALALCIVVKYCKSKHLQHTTSNLLSPVTSLNSYNPDFPLDEQIDSFSYDSNWEFPPARLRIIRTLGEGAFGRVVLAQAIGFGQTDATKLVAVKMLKPNADSLQIKALISELKILIHMGHHLNIVNCLGAVTKNKTPDKLMVIVEYCEFGNLRNFLRERREIFIDQINFYDQNNNFSKTNKHNSYVEPHNLAEKSCSTINNDSGNCSNSNDESRAFIRESKHDSNSNDNEQLSTFDLITIAFQVARGMEYLQHKKLIHRDLAARNVLVADRRVVKICDFGLTKDIQKDYNYIKKVDTPLPIKWMAIESIGDRVYTTQSDVWSFGVLLWEIFTLGGSPYPGLPADQHFYQKLVKGYRMERPDKCPESVYKIMTDCWLSSPNSRPNFSKLVNRLYDLIDQSTRDYYTELDTAFEDNEYVNIRRNNAYDARYLKMERSSSNSKLKNGHENSPFSVGASSCHKKTEITQPAYDNSSQHYDAIEYNRVNEYPMEVVSMIHFED